MKLFLAEKPSVAKNIADALHVTQKHDGYYEGNGYIVTWAFGHLLELYDAIQYDQKMSKWEMENFPFIPNPFCYKVKDKVTIVKTKKVKAVDPGAKKQLEIIKSLAYRKDVDTLISSCDADREGANISNMIWTYLGVLNKKPIYTIWLNEWTPNEVQKGLKKLIPNQKMVNLQQSGIARQQADWLIGINFTSVATLKYSGDNYNLLNIGRVQLPTLKMIYDRDKTIAEFKPVPYHKLEATFGNNQVSYEGIYFEDKQDKFLERTPLLTVLRQIEGKSSIIVDKKVEEKLDYPKSLFNLSGLQGYVCSKFDGFSSDKVLKVAQSLYEKKYITYPRTASTALEESLIEKAKAVLEAHKKGLPFENEIQFTVTKRVFNNAKVESHSAIIPTYIIPKDLTKDEEIVFNCVRNRFLAQFMPPAKVQETSFVTQVQGTSYFFYTRGKIQTYLGYKQIEPEKTEEVLLPSVDKGFLGNVIKATSTDHKTKPPAPYTEKTILTAMETCGKQTSDNEQNSEEIMSDILSGFSIGTPATRAETLKKLLDTGYTVMEKKNIRCTDKGKYIIEKFPLKELMDLDYTGRLEKALYDIEKGILPRRNFDSYIVSFVVKGVESIKAQSITDAAPLSPQEQKENESIAICPECGHPILESEKSFYCSNYKEGCSYTLWKKNFVLEKYGKKISKIHAKALIKNGEAEIKNVEIKGKKKILLVKLIKEESQPGKFKYTYEVKVI